MSRRWASVRTSEISLVAIHLREEPAWQRPASVIGLKRVGENPTNRHRGANATAPPLRSTQNDVPR
jgi:hypothetical protein